MVIVLYLITAHLHLSSLSFLSVYFAKVEKFAKTVSLDFLFPVQYCLLSKKIPSPFLFSIINDRFSQVH